MRPIKFRAWDKETKCLIPWEGILALIENKPVAIAHCFEREDWLIFAGNPFKLERLEMMQFTGLLDKNGKEICEGDIVRDLGEPDLLIDLLVAWDSENCKFVRKESTIKRGFDISSYRCWAYEVIGNIHENPELVEQRI